MSTKVNRITDDMNPYFQTINVLAYNQLSTQCGKMKTEDLHHSHKALVLSWAETIFLAKYNYLNIPESVTTETLKVYINSVKHGELLRRAKDTVSTIINKCNPAWIPPEDWESGKKLADMIRKVIEAMWNRLEEDRIKKAKKDSTARKDADSSTPEQRALPDGWRFPELILFEYFGLPSGENSCLEVLKTPVVGSGPTPVNPNSLGKSARNTIALGEKNSVAEKKAEKEAREEYMLMATGLALTNNNLLSKHNMEKNRLFEMVLTLPIYPRMEKLVALLTSTI